MTIEVPISSGKMVVIIDDIDVELVLQYNWFLVSGRHTFYAIRNMKRPGRKSSQSMHTMITGFRQTDHVDGNGLNNIRENLREVTTSQNKANAVSKTGTSRFKGVCWRADIGKWRAYIMKDYKRISIGNFVCETDAAIAYNEIAVKLFGEYAKLNTMEEL